MPMPQDFPIVFQVVGARPCRVPGFTMQLEGLQGERCLVPMVDPTMTELDDVRHWARAIHLGATAMAERQPVWPGDPAIHYVLVETD